MVVFGWRLLVRRARFSDSVGVAVVAGAVVAPWFIYVRSIMGGIMPSSGVSESGMATSAAGFAGRIWVMTSALIGALSSVVFLPTSSSIPTLALAAVLFVGLRWLGPFIRTVWSENRNWIVGAAVLAVYYMFFSTAQHFYPRYLAPLWLFWTELVAAAICLALSERPRSVAVWRHQFGSVAMTLLFAVEIGYTVHRGHASNSHLYSAFYVQRHSAELGTVGAFQSGVVGYVNRERIINLDGKLDVGALRQRGHLECYLAERGITTLVDWPKVIAGAFDPSFATRHLREVDAVPEAGSVVVTVDASGIRCG
jgi:hypothetical protein